MDEFESSGSESDAGKGSDSSEYRSQGNKKNDDDDEYNSSQLNDDEMEKDDEEEQVSDQSDASTEGINLKEELDMDINQRDEERAPLSFVPCNLDRKLAAKLKKYEFQPIWDGVLYNISPLSFVTLKTPFTETPPLLEFNDEKVTETENFSLSTFWDADDPSIMKEYINLRNLIVKHSQENPHQYISFQTLREITSNVDIVYLAAIYRVMPHVGRTPAICTLDNYSLLMPSNSNLDEADESQKIPPPLKQCLICSHECHTISYILLTNESFILCANCFHTGKFPHNVSSRCFKSNYGCLAVPPSKNQTFTECETLKLIESVQNGDDWTTVANIVGKSPIACQTHLVSLEYFSNNNTILPDQFQLFLDVFVKKDDNPIMVLINLVSNSVHPSLGAYCAKTALTYLLSTEITNLELNTLEACKHVYEKALETCKKNVDIYNETLRDLVIDANKLLNHRIKIKLGMLKHLEGALGNSQREQAEISKIIKDWS